MKVICGKRCIIGEGPVWNEEENLLYFINAYGNEICMLDIYTGELRLRTIEGGVSAMAFDKEDRLIVSRADGVYYLNNDNTMKPLYDMSQYCILRGNDMKVGPDGRLYVGTQSGKRCGVSAHVDGKLYSIDSAGRVRVLLDGLSLSNGLEWSMNENKFYHTDSDTCFIKEYDFDKASGNIAYTGRQVRVEGVDGFTMDQRNKILAPCWGKGHMAVINSNTMEIETYMDIPSKIPVSCGFAGKEMEYLAVVTASRGVDLKQDVNAGFTYLCKYPSRGRKPYRFRNGGMFE